MSDNAVFTFDALEMVRLRDDRAWSWYELAQRYGITETEVRRVYRLFKLGRLA
jgi:DNA-binding Xre family transcriptional regulator